MKRRFFALSFLIIFIFGVTLGYFIVFNRNNQSQKSSQEFWGFFISSVSDFYKKITFFSPASEVNSDLNFTLSDKIEPSKEIINKEETNNNIEENAEKIVIQEEIDDILEKIDIIKSEIEKLESQKETPNDLKNNQEKEEIQDNIQQEIEEVDHENLSDINNVNNIFISSASGGSVEYSKILISEIQTSGTSDEKEEFVELYNPNNEEIILTDWYLQRKTEAGSSYSTFVSNNLFSGKKIGGLEYFLIARQGSGFEGLADIITESSLGDSGSSSTLVFKNPNREISDKLGFGAPQEYELLPAITPDKGKSLGRKWHNDTEQDADNNSADFEIQIPTPKARNVAYVPLIPTGPILADITAPQISFNLNQAQSALNFTIDFTIEDSTETVSPSGVASYIFRWKEGEGAWQEDLEQQVGGSVSADLIRDFLGEDEKIYYFQAKAKDVLGNESLWLPETPAETKINIPKKVLINEIYFEEENKFFIELFNPNSQDINLTGWYLQRRTETGSEYASFIPKTQFEGKNISAKDYFLIARQGSGFAEIADILTENPLTENNSLVFKNSEGDISDKLGFGTAIDFETVPSLAPETGKSLGRKWVDILSQDTENNFDDFELQTKTPKAQNIVFIEPPKDTTPPEVIFASLEAVQKKLDFIISFEITDSLGAVTPSGPAGYFFKWKEEGGEWNEGSFQNFSENPVNINFSGQDQKTYYFQAKAKDIAGNESSWQPELPIETSVILEKNILINEVQIAPIEQRFVELYNPNNYEINLTGWYLQRKTENDDLWGTFVSSANFEGKIILANGYFLISRELLDSDILLNITLTENNSLALKNSNREIIDKVGWGQAVDFEEASAENPPENKSITRSSRADTDNNILDFIISDAPTPKAE